MSTYNIYCYGELEKIIPGLLSKYTPQELLRRPRWYSWMRLRLETRRSRVRSLLRLAEIDHEILSTGLLSLPLIQEGQLSISGERMCTGLVNRLEESLPNKGVVG